MSHTAATLADQAALAVHELALLARPGITTLDLSELRTTAGALAELAAALPQTLHQLSSYLDPAESLTATDGQFTRRPPTAAGQARTGLRHAAAAAAHLAAALDAAHQTLGDIAETIESNPRGSNFNRR